MKLETLNKEKLLKIFSNIQAKKWQTRSRGQIIIVAAIFLSVALATVVYLSSRVISSEQAVRHTNAALVAITSAEAGVQKALACLNSVLDDQCGGNAGPDHPGESNVSVGSGKFTSTVTVSGNKRTITSTGEGLGITKRKIRATAVPIQSPTGIPFSFAILTGDGGLLMEQNSEIRGAGTPPTAGNVYSNGPVIGENGAKITGDVTVATTTLSLDGMIVYGTANTPKITNSKICGDAYYETIDSSSLSFVNNPKSSTCPIPLTPGTGAASSTPPRSNMPITSDIMNKWKNDAASMGTIIGDCGDEGAPECTIPTDGTLSLGPKKINGNLVLTKKQTLIVTGTIYLTGHLDMDSSSGATVKCDPSFGAYSCLIIVDGWVHIKNNAIFQGSGADGSYLMVISTLVGCNGGNETPSCTHHNASIDLHNNASGAIFYAGDSMIFLHNGVNATELVANKLHLDNNAIITYEQGLLNTQFSSGPLGVWQIEDGSWQEIK